MSGTEGAPTTTTVVATWRGGRRYEVARPGGPATVIDASGEAGTGPVDTLLGALAACASIDVEDYLAKRRTPARALVVTVTAARRAAPPRRVMSAHLAFAIEGEGIEAPHALRAVSLAVERYCSVAASLASDLAITHAVTLNGTPLAAAAPAAAVTGDSA